MLRGGFLFGTRIELGGENKNEGVRSWKLEAGGSSQVTGSQTVSRLRNIRVVRLIEVLLAGKL